MNESTRRWLLGLALVVLILPGCDSNPNGPAFPPAPTASKDGDGAAGEKGGPGAKGRKKGGPARTLSDPAKD